MKKILVIFLFPFWLCGVAKAQYQTAPIFSTGAKIELTQTEGGQFYHHHTIQKGQTLYSLAKTFSVSLEVLQDINHKSTSNVDLGEVIKVPIAENYLYKASDLTGTQQNVYIPVVYVAKAQDNLYRISKVYFDQPMEMLKARNNMTSNNISLGQEILLGWYPISYNYTQKLQSPTQEAVPTAATDPNPIAVSEMEHQTTDSQVTIISNKMLEQELKVVSDEDFNDPLLEGTTPTDEMKLLTTKDVAYWDKNIPNNGEIYVLHNSAEIDTYVELYNELAKRSVKAKVIGKIPFGAYTSEVRLIISPATAQALGALDERLRVEMKYYQSI